MSLIKLQFKPGINRDTTNYSAEGSWWDCDKMRFRSGFPEKIGGWMKASPYTFLGVCRQMWNWVTSYNDPYVAVGTQKKVYLEQAGYFNDITPLRETFTGANTNNCIYTTISSTTVVANLATAHGASDGSYMTFSGVTGDVGGVPNAEINDNHEITVINATAFSFTVDTAATSTVSAGGGTGITAEFEIEPGYAVSTAGYGWGTGSWSRDAWGLGSDDPLYLPQRDWWFDNFDNDLVMNIRNGAAYIWERGTDPNQASALATRAITLQEYASNAGYDPNAVPVKIMQLMISQQDRHLIAFGAVQYGSTDPDDFDPMLIRWANQDDPGQWAPAVTNTSGFYRISRGSRIVRALPTRQEILIWSDTHLYSMQFLANPDSVFGVQEYADNVSIMSARACASAASVTYWMGQDKFYMYSGRIETMPCTVRNYVFNDLNYSQSDQVICGTNEEWNEIWWFYPSALSEVNDRYVVYNHLEQIWYYGTIARTSWLDTPLREFPIATNSDDSGETSYLYNHEDGVDDDAVAMSCYIQSNDFDLGDGDRFMLSTRVIPDISFSGSTVTAPEASFAIRSRYFPGTTYQDDAADTQNVVESAVDQYTGQIFIRARGRQMALKVSSSGLGVQFQLGSPRLDLRPDGRR